jgi:DNA ligase (NAD+)
VGEKAGSKLKKAQELGTVKIISEEDFVKMVEG